ncbi:MAG: ribonuclease III [Calditrichaeota bacterium]|nr:ribonuclease III [Calditrichota bacterium]
MKKWFSKISLLGKKEHRETNRSEDEEKFSRLYQALHYRFKDPALLILALKHRSFVGMTHHSHAETNERLEFLGDAILGLIVTEFLYKKYPTQPEGRLTEIKSLVVSRKILTQVARKIHLGEYLYLGMGEEKSGGRDRSSIISDAMEAVFGAVYLDGGYEAIKSVIDSLILAHLDDILHRYLNRNFKSQLLEYTQAHGFGVPRYFVEEETGPEHDKSFRISVQVKDKTWGVGQGKNKKQAEQQAAKDALSKIEH